jgi:hypothetical protein
MHLKHFGGKVVYLDGPVLPDWDLDAPGLRDAWEAGDRSPFHGFDSADG